VRRTLGASGALASRGLRRLLLLRLQLLRQRPLRRRSRRRASGALAARGLRRLLLLRLRLLRRRPLCATCDGTHAAASAPGVRRAIAGGASLLGQAAACLASLRRVVLRRVAAGCRTQRACTSSWRAVQ